MRRFRYALLLLLSALAALGAGFVLAAPHIVTVKVIVASPAAKPTAPAPTPIATVIPQPIPTDPIPEPCLRLGAVSQPYANDPGKVGPKAFGPPANRDPRLASVKAELRFRLCGREGHGPDERLWAAIDSAVNNSNPNLRVSNGLWVNSVNRLVSSQLHWETAKLVSRDFGPQAKTLETTRGTFPLIELVAPTPKSSSFLVIQATARNGHVVTLWLREVCGFQPHFAAAKAVPSNLRQLAG